jgi:hypothetical protein
VWVRATNSCHPGGHAIGSSRHELIKGFYIMDHEVVPCSPKLCDWLLNSSRYGFSLCQEKLVGVTMELGVPKRPILKPTLSIVMFQQVCGERGKSGSLASKITKSFNALKP